jgi:uncharacterized Tic20 family protein
MLAPPPPPLAPSPTGQLTPLPAPKGNDKLWSVLSHLSGLMGVGFLLPLVVYLVMKNESEYVAANSREALNFHISILIYALCCIPLCIVLIGIPMILALVLASVVLGIIGAVKASEGTCYRYPLTLRLIK